MDVLKHILAMVTAFLVVIFMVVQSEYVSIIDQYLMGKNFRGVALIARGDQAIHHKGYGLANEEHHIPNTTETVFKIGSLTKQFTAVAILQLQERGLLNVNDPVSKFIPDYPNGDKITLHHLLSHSAGIPDVTELSDIAILQRRPTTALKTLEYFKYLPLEFEPGTDCKYSNSGPLVLGAIIEIVTKQSYENYLKANVFEPLNMASTYYPLNTRIIPHHASGYRMDSQGNLHIANFVDMSFPHASGGLASTASDLFKLTQNYKSESILSTKSKESLFQIHALSQMNKIAYGYGIQVGPRNSDFEELPPSTVGHRGNIEGFEAIQVYIPDSDLIIIILSNLEATDLNQILFDIVKILQESWRLSQHI